MQNTTSPALSEAAAYLSHAPSLSKLNIDTKLELYGLYKFLTVAPQPQSPRPSLFDMARRAKWNAWSGTGERYKDRSTDAEARYLNIARTLGWVPGAAPSSPRSKTLPGEVWDDELNVSIPDPSGGGGGGGGMGTAVSAPLRPVSDEAETLHKLAIEGDADKLSRLLATHPPDIDGRDEFGYTPLHLACDRGNLAVVEVLLKYGGDPMLTDPDDLTAAQLAEIAGHDRICKRLLETSLDGVV